MADFQAVTREAGDVSIIELSGYLDAHTTSKLEESLTVQIEQKRFKIVVDFENLKYISSAGLGVFMAFIETMRENNGDIKLAAMQPNVFNIFDLLGFPLLYEIFPLTQEAVNKFSLNSESAS